MKSYIILFLFFCTIVINAQNYPVNIIPKDFGRVNQKEGDLIYSLTGNYEIFYDLNRIKCDGKPCESGTYKRIEFENDGIQFYFSGKLKKYKETFQKYGKHNGKWKMKRYKKDAATVIPSSDVYYKSTNNVVSDSRYKNATHFNHENGKTKSLKYYSNNEQLKFLQIFDKKENVIVDAVLKGYIHNEVPCPRKDIGKCKKSFLFSEDISLFAKRQSTVTHKNGDVFSGYATASEYYSKLGYQFSGYTLPMMDYNFGNGSVLLMTNQTTGAKKWVVYVDGNVDFEMDADKNASLEIEALHANLDIDYKVYSYSKNVNLKGEKKDIYLQQGRAGGIAIINVTSKNINTHNGYGMSIKTVTEKENDIPFSTKECQVGFFKNGKLHGIGYKVKIRTTWVKDYDGGVTKSKNNAQISYKYGRFENGELIDGRFYKGYENKDFNIWKTSPIAGLKYIGKHKPETKTVNASVFLSDIQVNDEVYLDTIMRMVKVKSIDRNSKTITVTGYDKEIATVNAKDGKIYLHKIISNYTHKEGRCNVCYGDGIESIPQYKTTYKERSWTTGTMHLHTKDGRFGRGTKTYTSYTPKRVVSGYTKVTCAACNGTGKTHYTNTTKTKNLYLINWNDKLIKPTNKTLNNTSKKVVTSDKVCISGNCKNGWGKMIHKEVTYEGTFKNGIYNGMAFVKYKNGGTYQGEFRNGYRDGVGLYTWKNGNTYIGWWLNDKQNTYGYEMNAKKEIINGGWYKNGQLETNYVTKYLNNNVTGNCRGNCSSNFGKMIFDNGDYYIGFFKNNNFYATGLYVWKNGGSYLGDYINGKRQGYGVYTYPNGNTYKGYHKNNELTGFGVMKKNSGEIIPGNYEKGILITQF